MEKIIATYLIAIIFLTGCGRQAAKDAKEASQKETQPEQELSLGFSDEAAVEQQAGAAEEIKVPEKRAPIIMPTDAEDIEKNIEAIEQMTREAMFTEAWQLARDFRAENQDHPRIAELNPIINRLNRLRRDAPEILYALNQIDDPNPTVRDIVERQLVKGGEVAVIILRKKLRETDDTSTALLAAELLQRTGDTQSLHDILLRIENKDPEKERELIQIAAEMLANSDKSTAIERSATILSGSSSKALIPLAEGLFTVVNDKKTETEEKAYASAADYLQRITDGVEDPVLLAGIARAAAASGSKELQREFMVPGNPQDAEGEVIASSKSHKTLTAVNAFENDERWLPEKAALPEVFITYKFTDGYAYMVDRYRIMTQHHNHESRAPVDFALQGSNNGEEWTVVDTVRGEADWGPDEWREFDVDNPGLYQYYKLTIEKFSGNDSNGYGGIRNIEYHGEWRQPR